MIRVKLIGATGYGGIGMIELLNSHPETKLVALVATQDTGKPISDVWPHLDGFCDMPILAADAPEAQVEADLVVCSTPDRVGQSLARDILSQGARLLDYSGDFRFTDAATYAEYARRIGKEPTHLCPELLSKTAYGLAELHRKEISGSEIVGNPGCFAVSCIMGLAPAAKEKLLDLNGIVCDCKTGVSGAGKKAALTFHYPERYDAMNAYRLTGHQHVMEIERELTLQAGSPVTVTFTPQVVPACRGILSTLYGRLAEGATQEKVLAAYRAFYAGERFVRVLDASQSTSTAHVRGSNFVNLQVACDERTGTFRVISHIDNLMKGQAASALQNLNLMFGLEETMGLDFPGRHP